MLAQYVHALQGLLAPCLLVASLDVLLSAPTHIPPKLQRIGSRWRLGGLCVGLALAVLFAALRASAVLDRRSTVNFPILCCCLITDLAVIVVLIRCSAINKHPRSYIAANICAAAAILSTVLYATPNVILQLTNFVEPGDSPFTSAMAVRAIGFLLGVATAIAVAAILRTLSHTAIRSTMMIAIAAMVVLLTLTHILDFLALLTNMRYIALHGVAFRWFIRLRNWSVGLAITQVAVFALPALSSLLLGFRRLEPQDNIAHTRQAKARRRRSLISAIASIVAIVVAAMSLSWGTKKINEVPQLSPPEAYSVVEHHAHITLAQVADGHLHRFEYTAEDGTHMRFIIIKKNGGAYGVGLDACETCGDAGYYEKDGKIICKRCDVAINLATIGFKGGCNPVPVPYSASKGVISIDTNELDALSSHFK